MFGNRIDRLHYVVLFLLAALSVISSQSSGMAGDKKLSIPSAKTVKKAEALVKELYVTEFKRAGEKIGAKANLAAVLLQEGRDTSDYPAGRYVLFLQARDLAAQSGRVALALQAIDELALSFSLPKADVFAMKVQTLQRASRAKFGRDEYRDVADAALALIEEALELDDYQSAMNLIKTAETAGIKLRNVPMVARIRQRKAEVVRLKKSFDRIRPFVLRLKSKPKDAEANLQVGKYHAFEKENWIRGLPFLAMSSHELIRKSAKLDLLSPGQAKQQLQLAESWRRIAGSLDKKAKFHVLLRAYHWYQQAELGLTGKVRRQVVLTMDALLTKLPAGYRIGELTREVKQYLGHDGPVFDVTFSPDGRRLATGGQDGAVLIWNVKTGKIIRRLSANGQPIWTVAYSPDGKSVAAGGFDNTIRLWEPISGRLVRTLTGHTDYVRGLAFSNGGDRLLSCGDDRTLRLWNVESGKELLSSISHKHFVWDVALSRNGKLGVSASLDRTVGVWRINNVQDSATGGAKGNDFQRFKGHTDTVLAVAISRGGRHILSGSSDKTVRLWDARSGKPLFVMKGHEGYVTSVAFTPDGRRAISAGYDNTIILWDLQTGKEVRRLNGHVKRIWSVTFSRAGRRAASASHDASVRLWSGSKK